MKYISLFSACLILLLSSCNKDSIIPGSSVTVTNTLELAAEPANGGTGGVETPVETILGVPAGTFVLTAEVGDGIEFDDYLSGLYDIDLSENAVTFTLVAQADDPIYSGFFRTIEAGTFDRYYFRFDQDQKIKSFSSNNSSVTLNTIADNEFMVQISEGFSFNPGTTFTITLQK